MKEKWEFMCYKLPEFVQKCSQLTLEQTLTWAKDFKNPKLFSLMEICVQNLIFLQLFCNDIVKSLQMTTFALKLKFCIHISIELKNFDFL